MQFRKILALRGPNVWANFPVLEAWVDLEELKDSPSDSLPGFNDRLMAWLPTMIEHRCSVGERGGFFERLRRGTWPGHILEHVCLELQSLAGTTVGYGRARETHEEGVYKVVVEYREEALARAALQTAHDLIQAAIHDRPFDVAAEVEKLKLVAFDVCLGPSTRSIVEAAVRRGIPHRRLSEGSLVQFGHGAKQRRILAAETHFTGAIAETIAQDKNLTRTLLRTVGVPVPEGRPVSDADDAWAAAVEIGHPVVVKPQYGSQGRGVTTNLTTRAQVAAAFDAARQEGQSIIVERYAPGDDYRILVVGDQMIAAARREPAQVTGDGKSTVRQLVDEVNRDPRRSNDHATVLSKIKLDAIALATLAEQSFAPENVPPSGQVVLIRRNANLSTGGTAIDVTDRVHPEVARRAIEAARVIGLDVAGVDVIALDIGKPLEQQAAVVVEVNASPGLRMHIEPSAGAPRPVGDAIIAHLFAAGENGRIPIVSVTGVNGKTTTTRVVTHILKSLGKRVGMTCTDGIFIDGRRIDSGDCSGPVSAQAVLFNPQVDAAVLETARGGILRAGLGFDFCDVAVVTNIGEGDHLGLHDVEDLETLAKVKRCPVDVVLPTGYAVLKADDPYTAGMAKYCKGGVIFFAQRADDPVIGEHLAQGGRAMYVRGGMIIAAEGETETDVVALADVPLTHAGRIGFQVENALAAAAAAWGLGISRDAIRSGLESFAADMEKSPGRFNLLEIGGATVVVDYGHNPSALLALIDALDQFPHERRICVYSAAGDRRDVDMVRQGEILGDGFDKVILYEDHYLRGRAPGEIMSLFRQGLEQGSRVCDVVEIQGGLKAVEAALRAAQPRDLVLIQADVIDETVEFVKQYIALSDADREIDLNKAINVPTVGPSVPISATPVFAAQIVD